MELQSEYQEYSLNARVWAILATRNGQRMGHRQVAREYKEAYGEEITPRKISWAVYWLRTPRWLDEGLWDALAKKEGKGRSSAKFPLGHDPTPYLEFFRKRRGPRLQEQASDADLGKVPPLKRTNQPI